MPFSIFTYPGLISERSQAQSRLVPEPDEAATAFDVIVVGSGMGGGLLADQRDRRVPADRPGPAGAGPRGRVLPVPDARLQRRPLRQQRPGEPVRPVHRPPGRRGRARPGPPARPPPDQSGGPVRLLVRADPGDPAVGAALLPARPPGGRAGAAGGGGPHAERVGDAGGDAEGTGRGTGRRARHRRGLRGAGDPAGRAPALPHRRRHPARPLLVRVHGRVQHRGAAAQPARPYPATSGTGR